MNKLIELKLSSDIALNDMSVFQDELTPEERDAILPPGMFWDERNARPRTQAPAAAGMYAANSMPARDQHSRKTCVSFALTAAVELRGLRRGVILDLSEQDVAAQIAAASGRSADSTDEAVRLFEALRVLKGKTICTERAFPYRSVGSEPPLTVRKSATYGIKEYLLIPRFESQTDKTDNLTPCLDGPGVANAAYLETIISLDYDIVVVLCLTDTQAVDPDTGVIVIDCDREATSMCCVPRSPNYAHAVVITGYVRSAPYPYFVCRDSLPGLSFGKPLLISYDYMRVYAEYGAVVTDILS
jgi:hypothetical protein